MNGVSNREQAFYYVLPHSSDRDGTSYVAEENIRVVTDVEIVNDELKRHFCFFDRASGTYAPNVGLRIQYPNDGPFVDDDFRWFGVPVGVRDAGGADDDDDRDGSDDGDSDDGDSDSESDAGDGDDVAPTWTL